MNDTKRSQNQGLFSESDQEWLKLRIGRIIYPVIIIFAVLIARLFYLQIINGEKMRSLSENNSIRIQRVEPYRGLIYDRKGVLLVDNRPSFDLVVVPRDAGNLELTIKKLSDLLQIDPISLDLKAKRAGKSPVEPVILARDIDRDQVARVEAKAYDLPGVNIMARSRRSYVHPGLASHLIGYLGEICPRELAMDKHGRYRVDSEIGKFGVERSFEDYLRGKPGGRQIEVDARGREIRELDRIDPVPGNSLYLTIDGTLQKKAESLLAKKTGAIVAVEPFSGEVLAMASSPGFDQNRFIRGMTRSEWNRLRNDPSRPLQNRAIQAAYPPGSVYKVVSAMAALEEGLVDEKKTFFCPGYFSLGDRDFRCWKISGHGRTDLTKALVESCDVYFYNIGLMLGVDRLADYAVRCGLGRRTGIRLENEVAGLVPTTGWKKAKLKKPWYKGETLPVVIGQGYNLVTPLQIAMLTAAIANNGMIMQPLILNRVVDEKGEDLKRSRPRKMGRLPVSPRHLELIRRALFDAVNTRKGTAWNIHDDSLKISGKTGTAQVRSSNRDLKGRKEKEKFKHLPHAWFAGYAPYDHPAIAVTAIVEHGAHGSTTAAPIVKEIISTWLAEKGKHD